MPETTNPRHIDGKTTKDKMKKVGRMKARLSPSSPKVKKAKSDNALIQFFKKSYNSFRTQPQVDQTLSWVKENPKKSIGIGLGLLLLTRSRRATNFAKLGLSSGMLGWLFNQSQQQKSLPESPMKLKQTETSTQSPTRSDHLH
jgi:ElaB/YqjD/DUF883 family membrane-anchored ribosome-binding protein